MHEEQEVPFTPKPRDRRALSAYRHGLTGQIHIFTPADHTAYEKHCQGYHKSLAPVGPVEIDLVQSIAEDRWRLKRASALESAIFAEGLGQPDEVTSGNARSGYRPCPRQESAFAKGGNLQLPRTLREPDPTPLRKEHGRASAPFRPTAKPPLITLSKKPISSANWRKAKREDAAHWQSAVLTKFDFSSTDVSRMLPFVSGLSAKPKTVPGATETRKTRRLILPRVDLSRSTVRP